MVLEGFQEVRGIGICPSEWKATHADKICSKITKGTTPPRSEIIEDNAIPFLRVNNLTFCGKLEEASGMQFVSEQAHRGFLARSIAYPNDILMNIVGPPLGKIALLAETFPEYNLNQAIVIYRVNSKDIDKRFFLFYLMSSPAQQWFRTRSKKTSGQQNLTIELCKELPVPLPPLPEQKKIARILSTWDKAIETVEKLIEYSKAQKKALMQQLLTGKRRLPGFDEEWKTIRLDDVLDGKKRKGKIVPTNDEKRGVAYIGSTSFNGDFGIYTDSSDAVICSLKDILVLWDGENAGKATTGLSGAVSSTVVRCRIDESKANSRFITYNLLKDNYKVRAIREGSGIPHMPGDFEHWYHINLPPLKEQQEIAAILTSADKEIETLQQKLDYLKQEKKSLMQQILTGKRRVIIN